MKTSGWFWSLALVVLVVASHGSHAQTKPQPKPVELQLVGTGPFPVAAVGDKATVWLSVKVPDTLVASDLRLTRQSVRFERRPDADIENRFAVEPSLLDEKRTTPTLALTVSELAKLSPGQYEITISVSSKNAVVAPLSITLDRRPAQFMPPGKQTVDVEVAWPWAASASGTSAPRSLRLLLADEGRESAVRSITLADGPFTAGDASNVRATLGAAAASSASPKFVSFDLSPSGFPIGTSQGKLEIHSPDLKSPTVVDVEVRTRLKKPWIAVMVIAGLLLGYALRIELQHRLDLAKAKDQGLTVLDAMDRQRSGAADAKYLEEMTAAFATLEAAVLGKDPQAIAAAIPASQEAASTALKDLNQRLEAAAEQVKLLIREIPGPGSLPESLARVVESLVAVADSGAHKLRSRDAKGVADDVELAVAAAAKTLRLECARILAMAADADATYREVTGMLDQARSQDRETLLKAFAQSAIGPGADPGTSVQEIGALLDAWRRHGAERAQAIARLAGYLEADAKALDALVRSAAGDRLSALDSTRQAWSSANQAIIDGLASVGEAGDPYGVPTLQVGRAVESRQGLMVALLAIRADVQGSAKEAFELAVAKGRVHEAVRGLPPVPVGATTLGTSRARPFTTDAFPDNGNANRPVVAQAATSTPPATPSVERLSDPRRLEAYAANNRRQLAVAGAVQTIGVAAILAVASLAFFRDRFMGTPMELAGLFFWGFTADLSVAKLAELAGGWAAKPKTTV